MNRSKREPRISRRIGLRARGRRHHSYLGIEPLEPRQLLSSVQWTSATSGAWDVGSNWSTGQVPGSGDDVVIDVNGATPTVTIDSGDQSVHSLMASDPLSITGGSLTVAANSTISDGLTMTGGSLTASGSGVNLKVTGSTAVSEASLFADGGATLNLPNLASYTGSTYSYYSSTTFAATGTGSTLSLGALATATLAAGGTIWYVQASKGGQINLPQLATVSVTGGSQVGAQFTADGGGSQIDLSSLTSLSGRNSDSSLTVTHGGSILDGKLTTLNEATVTLDGTGTIATSQWASFTNFSSITVTGGSYTLSGMNDLDGSVLTVSGGTLSLPNVFSYTGSNYSYYSSTAFSATGAGSTLSLGALATATLATGGTIWNVNATKGGQINLPHLATVSVTGGSQVGAQFAADGNGSQIDLSSLTSLSGRNSDSSLTVTHGGSILDGKLTTLNEATVTLDGTGSIATSQWASFTNFSSINVTGGSYNLSGMTDFDGSFLTVNGGASLSLPNLTTYTGTIYSYYSSSVFTATGAGSTLSLGALNTATLATGGTTWDVNAAQGGQIDLPHLATVALTGPSQVGAQFSADGAGSLIDLSGLTTINGPGASVSATNSGSVRLSGGVLDPPTSGAGASVNFPAVSPGLTGLTILLANGNFSGGTTFNVAANDTVDLIGGTYTGGATFNVGQGATVDLTGGQTTTYGGTLTGSGPGTVQLSGGTFYPALGGATLNFPGSMFQWTGGGMALSVGDVTNAATGTINLSGGNQTQIYADGTLDNFGTIIQTGTGDFGLHSDNVTPTTLRIEAGGSYMMESDAGINNLYNTNVIDNAGTIKKTGGTGTSTIGVNGPLNNTGTIEADSGTLSLAPTSFGQVTGTTLTGGTWSALNGASLQFPNNTTIATNEANITLSGKGAAITSLAGLSSNSGSLSLASGAGLTTTGDLSNSGTLTVGAASTLEVGGDFTQTSAGTLESQINGQPASGLFGEVLITGAASLGGNFNVELQSGVTPGRNAVYQVMTFASAGGTFATVTGLGSSLTEQLTPTSLDLQSGTGTPIDLQLGQPSAPTQATAGQQITVAWQAKNAGGNAASGAWQDSVFLSKMQEITTTSILLGSVTHTGGLAAGASYNGNLTAAVPALPPGNYYIIVQADSLDQMLVTNRASDTMPAGTGQLTLSVPPLTLGTPTSGSFTAAGEDQYYQVTVPAGGALVVSLTSAASSGATALYVSQGALPEPYSYQEAAKVAGQPAQTVVVPQVLAAGTYYILAQSVSGAAGTAGFTLTATQTGALALSAISPTSGGNAGNVTVEIDGTNFTPSMTASLTLESNTIRSSAIDYASASQLFATFNLSGATTGSYTLSVRQGNQSVTAASRFQIVAANPLGLQINLNTPQYMRAGRGTAVVISYTNPTANDMVAPLLTILSTNSSTVFSTPDDPNNFVQEAQVLAVAPSGPAGILRPGQSGQLTVTVLSNDTVNNDTIPIQLYQIEPGQTINWGAQEIILQPSTGSNAAWNVIWGNLMATVGTTTDSYNAALAQAATYLREVGETTAQVSDVGGLWAFLESQADAAYPPAALASAVDAVLTSPGSLPLAVDRTFNSSISSRYEQGIFGPGWATSWQATVSADAIGDVTLGSGSATAYFFRQPNGSYLDVAGEFGTLTSSGGTYTFTDTAGVQYVFLRDGQLNYEQDTNGNRVTLGYNAQNQLVTLTYSSASDSSEPTGQIALTYRNGVVSQIADGTGNMWTYNYNSTGHLQSVVAPRNLTTSYSYDTGSNPETEGTLLSVTYSDGSQTNFTYDTQGRLASTSSNDGADTITFAYPGEAEVTGTDAAGHQATAWFNDLGLAARVEDPLGGLSNYLYDPNGNLVSFTDATGKNYHYTYDGNGNLAQIVDPLGHAVRMTYGSLSNLTTITDAGGNLTQYGYDPAGNLLNIAYPDGTKQSFSYDPLGNMSEMIERNGDPMNFRYNAQGLVTQESFADKTSESFAYDAHGNLVNAKTFDAQGNVTGTTTLSYNAANELLSIAYPGGLSLRFSYDPKTGQRTQSVDQDGFTVNYSYDTLGRLSMLKDGSGNPIVKYSYNNLGQLAAKLNSNGTSTVYGYDPAGNPLSIVNYAPDGKTVNSSFTYTYNLLGQVTSVTDSTGGVTGYQYDPIGQLTQVSLPGGRTISYAYNAAGDRTQVIDNGTTTSYSSNTRNEITQAGPAAYSYDANGNLHTVTDAGGTTSYDYNDLNQLVSIANPDGTVQSFQYSPLGFMVGESVGGTQTNYLVDPTGVGNLMASYDGSGSIIAHYTYGLGLVSQTGPSGAGYYDFELGGNTVGITGSAGSYVNRYSYLPFGETTTLSAALPNPFTFGGQLGIAQTGRALFYMGAREYGASTGQFLSEDPLGLAGGDPNLRRYASNNPANFVDPGGLKETSKKDDFNWDDALDNLGKWLEGKSDSGSSNQGGFSGSIDFHFPLVIKNDNSSDWGRSNGSQGWGENTTTHAIPGGYIDGHLKWGPSANSPQPDNGKNGQHSPNGKLPDNKGPKNFPKRKRKDKPKTCPQQKKSAQSNQALAVAGGGPTPAGCGCTSGGPAAVGQLPLVHPQQQPGCDGVAGNSKGEGDSKLKTNPDPNALIGPVGYGSQGFIQPGGVWSYTVEFENEPTAGTAAQDVTVTQQFDPNLDWSSFQLGSFGFGPINVSTPAGLTDYETTVAYHNTDGTPLNVQVAADFNVQAGLLTVSFTSLDPASGQAPAGVFDGFLPPDDKSGVGKGYVQYTIEPKAGLATGAAINQQASVVFDINAPILTNTALNTIDAGTPTSSVAALPATETPPTFNVKWSGSDGNGSGIADYNVYVSDNGGAYSLWQSNTTSTSAVYTGQAGHTYSFYSIATSNVGLVQPTPSAPQATTKVVLPGPPLVTMTKVRVVTNSKKQVTQVVITFSGAVNASEAANIKTYRLATPGTGGSYTAKNAGIITLKSALYNRANYTVTLTPTKAFSLTKPVQLLVYGTSRNGLQDSHGRLIDGDHNGTPGGNAVAILSAGGAKIQELPLVEVLSSAQEPRRQGAEAAAAIDALIARNDFFRSRLRFARLRA
jgi:RHS repeat-associated protein